MIKPIIYPELTPEEAAAPPPETLQKRAWTPERRARFRRTMQRKRREARHQEPEKVNPAEPEDLPHVLACPRCGLNIRNVALSIAFGEQSNLKLGAAPD